MQLNNHPNIISYLSFPKFDKKNVRKNVRKTTELA